MTGFAKQPVRKLIELTAMLGLAALVWGVTLGGPLQLSTSKSSSPSAQTPDDRRYRALRSEMVTSQIEARGLHNAGVLKAMRSVPRHRFVPSVIRELAYDDGPLPIGKGQTISQPYVVALMTSLIEPQPTMKVLEIGTGSGYQAAVLAECVAEVDTIETIPALGKKAEALLHELGYKNIRVRIGDGFDGWPEHAPFDAILVTAAPERVPEPLLDQLKMGGRLVAPIGEAEQTLIIITKTENGLKTESVAPVLFVPMTGKAQDLHDQKR
jgi:protein-L-isoaspartate(D-aspartate) O-methyltransferase